MSMGIEEFMRRLRGLVQAYADQYGGELDLQMAVGHVADSEESGLVEVIDLYIAASDKGPVLVIGVPLDQASIVEVQATEPDTQEKKE